MKDQRIRFGSRRLHSRGLHLHSDVLTGAKTNKKTGELCSALLLYIQTWLLLNCMVSTMKVSVQQGLFSAGLLFFTLLVLGVYFLNGTGKWLLTVLYAAVVGFLMWQNREWIAAGFFYLVNGVISQLNNYYHLSLSYYVIKDNQAQAVAYFMLFAAQPVLMLHLEMLFYNQLTFLSLLLMGVAAFWSTAVGLMPEERLLIPAVIFMAMMLARLLVPEASHKRFRKMNREHRAALRAERKPHRERNSLPEKNRKTEWLLSVEECRRESTRLQLQASMVIGGILLLLFLVVNSVITQTVYKEKYYNEVMKEELKSGYDNLAKSSFWDTACRFILERTSLLTDSTQIQKDRISDGFTSERIGGINSGRFKRGKAISFDNVTALKVTLPQIDQTVSVYLKGFNGMVYTYSGWEEFSSAAIREYRQLAEEYDFDAQSQTAELLKLFRNGNAWFSGLVLNEEQHRELYTSGRLDIDYITASRRYVYAPDIYEPGTAENLVYEQDAYVLPDRRVTEYQFDFYFLTADKRVLKQMLLGESSVRLEGDEALQEYQDAEMAYRSFVSSAYTVMPEGHEQLKALQLTAPEASVDQKVQSVAEFLSGYEYTLEPGAMPANTDFVDYFLFENKKGYCVHFASSAVLLLRSMGVPARYAEGYLITASDIGAALLTGETGVERMNFGGQRSMELVPERMVEVKDYSAHAWVEVYYNGIGWLPVEMTTGYHETGERPEAIMTEVERLPSVTPLPTNTPVPELSSEELTEKPLVTQESPETSPSAVPTPAEPESAAAPSVLPGGTAGMTDTDTKSRAESGLAAVLRWYRGLPGAVRIILGALWRLLCLLMLTVLVFAVRWRLVWCVRNRRRCSKRRRVLWYYHCMEKYLEEEKLCRLQQESYEEFAKRVRSESRTATEDFAQQQQLALRAGFSREAVSAQELDRMSEACFTMRKQLYQINGKLKVIYYKFIKLF